MNKIYKTSARLIKKKKRGLKSIKLERKKEKLHLTPQKQKELKDTTKSNSMPITWTNQKKWTNSWKGTIFQD